VKGAIKEKIGRFLSDPDVDVEGQNKGEKECLA
jgi:hypothetical protein